MVCWAWIFVPKKRKNTRIILFDLDFVSHRPPSPPKDRETTREAADVGQGLGFDKERCSVHSRRKLVSWWCAIHGAKGTCPIHLSEGLNWEGLLAWDMG